MLPKVKVYVCSENSLAKTPDNRHNNPYSRSSVHGSSVLSRLKHPAAGAVRHGHAHHRIRIRISSVRLDDKANSEARRIASASSSACAVKNRAYHANSPAKTAQHIFSMSPCAAMLKKKFTINFAPFTARCSFSYVLNIVCFGCFICVVVCHKSLNCYILRYVTNNIEGEDTLFQEAH